jgi:hypothetical protein
VELGRNLIEQLKEVEARFPGVEPALSGSAAFKEQEQRIDQLGAQLEDWTKLGEDER